MFRRGLFSYNILKKNSFSKKLTYLNVLKNEASKNLKNLLFILENNNVKLHGITPNIIPFFDNYEKNLNTEEYLDFIKDDIKNIRQFYKNNNDFKLVMRAGSIEFLNINDCYKFKKNNEILQMLNPNNNSIIISPKYNIYDWFDRYKKYISSKNTIEYSNIYIENDHKNFLLKDCFHISEISDINICLNLYEHSLNEYYTNKEINLDYYLKKNNIIIDNDLKIFRMENHRNNIFKNYVKNNINIDYFFDENKNECIKNSYYNLNESPWPFI